MVVSCPVVKCPGCPDVWCVFVVIVGCVDAYGVRAKSYSVVLQLY